MSPALRARRCDELLVEHKLSLGCTVLDRVLRGGLVPGTVTEVFGESTAGKTQLCLQLLLTVRASARVWRGRRRRPPPQGQQQRRRPDCPPLGVRSAPARGRSIVPPAWPHPRPQVQQPKTGGGLNGAALYLHTEGQPAVPRLRQIAVERAAAQGLAGAAASAAVSAACDAIFLHDCSGREPAGLLEVLTAAEVCASPLCFSSPPMTASRQQAPGVAQPLLIMPKDPSRLSCAERGPETLVPP